MSSEPSHQTGDIEETKQHIRAVLAELSQLAKTDITPEEFHAEFLSRVVASMAAVAGAVWIFDPRGGLTLSYQINLQAIDIRGSGEGEKQHSRLLYRLLEGPEGGTLVPAHSGYAGPAASANNLSVAVEGGEAGNPTATLIVSCPIRTELETVGLVEIFQRPDTSPGAQRGFVRFLAQSCLLATDYYKNRQLRHFGNRQSLWTLLEEFTRSIHRSLDVRQTAFTIVNEGRRLIECDRVSLAVRRG
ncbi:MAG TPA: hypothetical protein DEB39_10560, partial [Planctomycetaceae bacterium]|nr:hypothetical protein [Planctomycetaceae bacterium]